MGRSDACPLEMVLGLHENTIARRCTAMLPFIAFAQADLSALQSEICLCMCEIVGRGQMLCECECG